jgi:ABC-type lipoprotein release transport system permease subunit
LARNLKVTTGDEITLLGSDTQGGFAAGIATVVGIIESGSSDIDRSLAEVPLTWFQDIFAMDGRGHALIVRCNSLNDIDATVTRIRGSLDTDFDWAILDWETLQPGLKQAIQADLSSAWFMYGVLIILVSFSVLNTMLMSVLERTREFGILMALGIRPGKLAALVMFETIMIAGLGLLIGAALGWFIASWFHQAGFSYPGMEEMAERFNLPPKMYPSVTFFTVFLGPGVVFLFSLLAAVYPALRLFHLQPVAAMRAV